MNKKVVITVGVPGSGKSHYAELYAKANPGTVIIERDQIREEIEPGYYKKNPNKKVENLVTTMATSRLSKSLIDSSVNTIILSDTNLNESRRDTLVKSLEGRADVEIKLLTDSLDLNLCLKRNSKREKVVPDGVLIGFWKSYMTQFGEDPFAQIKEPIVFIGDIHSQYVQLKELLSSYADELSGHHLVFLGDINDSRVTTNHDKVSFLETYKIVKSLVDSGKATLIHSNHQKNLISLIRGRRKKLSFGLEATAYELEREGLIKVKYSSNGDVESVVASPEATDIANWLDSRPFFFKKGNIVGVHAQWLPKHCVGPYQVSSRGLEALIYGTKDADNNRNYWWLDYQDLNFFVVSGHYHEEYYGSFCAVVDSGCGQDGGILTAYNVAKNETYSV